MACSQVSLQSDTGFLQIEGDYRNDSVIVSRLITGPVRVRHEVEGLVEECDFPAASVERIIFQGGYGNDYFRNDTSIPSTAAGSYGEDTLIGGSDDDRLLGDRGEDVLVGRDGNDYLEGGSEDDRLEGGAGDDELDGQGGDDLLDGGDGNDLLAGADGNDRISGGRGDDAIYGSHGDDVLMGEEGHDYINGDAGNDLLYGGGGDDTLIGGSEDDYLDGGEGNDNLDGQAGNDFLLGGGGNDWLAGRTGEDSLYGGDGDDSLHGSPGNDVIVGGLGNDYLDGSDDDDVLFGSPGDDQILGGSGNDKLVGGEGDDALDGGTGNDSIHGEGGNDSVHGGAHDDILDGGDGDDVLNGRSGDDILLGGEGNDSLIGEDGSDVLVGGGANDVLDAGGGSDILIGGKGVDSVSGRSGEDLLIGGWTRYDQVVEDLIRIRDVWASNLSYQARIDALENAHFPAHLKSERTVFDDAVADDLGGHEDTDWFFLTGAMHTYTPVDAGMPPHGDSGDHHHEQPATGEVPRLEGFDFIDSLDRLLDANDGERIHTIVPHGTDPSKLGEHLALFELVRYDQATHIAASSGAWSSPSTWQDGRIPSAGANVLIPVGVQVRVDGLISAELHTVRVDGLLRFDTERNTTLRVDTVVVGAGGMLEMGTPQQPIRPDVTARLVIADSGPIDRKWDPFALSRGLISHGHVSIYGAEKLSHASVVVPPLAGTDVLVLSQTPEGWRAGDQIVIAGSALGQDEVRWIRTLTGNLVWLDAPLQYNHQSSDVTQQVHIANLTRNAVIESENKALDRRGHVMFMHTRNVNINYAGFYHLGRTNKLELVNDPVVDASWTLQEGTGTNPRARYSVHFHRNGVTKEGKPSVINGSVVWGSPGWGYVNHSSFVEITDSVSYDVSGSGFVTEVGDEIGSFRNNIAIRSQGSGEDTDARVYHQDFGHEGNGFWLQGAGVALTGNVSAGHSGHGFILYTRAIDHGRMGAHRFLAANLTDPALAEGAETIDVQHVPFSEFRDNVAYASGTGLTIRYHLRDVTHTGKSVFEESVFWNNYTGIALPYSRNLTLRNMRVVRPFALDDRTGVDSNLLTQNITYENLSVVGYFRGIKLPRQGYGIVRDGYFNNVWNFFVQMAAGEGRQVQITGNIRFGEFPAEILGSATQYEVVMRPHYEIGLWGLPHVFAKSSVTLNYGKYSNTAVFFQHQPADFVPFREPQEGVPSAYVGLTNQQLYNRFGLRIGGEFAPQGVVNVPEIIGLVSPIR